MSGPFQALEILRNGADPPHQLFLNLKLRQKLGAARSHHRETACPESAAVVRQTTHFTA